MKTPNENNKDNDLAVIAAEAAAVASGDTPPAREVVLERHADGSVARRVVAPGDRARDFPARTAVAEIRKATGLSQPAFAARLGISVSTVRKWESNQTRPSGPAKALLRIVGKHPELLHSE